MTGIGFLGAGVIIHGASGEVRGLTTAATMWAMTGVGVAVGSGHALLGALLAVLIYVIIASGQWPVLAWFRRRSSRTAAAANGARATQPTVRAEEHR